VNEELRPGTVTEIAPGIRRLIAPNAGMMTGPGTNTYLLGAKAIAVIDPGPLIQAHIACIQTSAAAKIRWILVTHTHPDHSPAAKMLAAASGAQLLGRPAPEGQHQDQTFHPDRILDDGETFQTDEFQLQAVHTPGHASNHLCYLHSEHKCLFTGDHIINGSTVVIDPPDGNMRQYLESLKRLKDYSISSIAPGHGGIFTNPFEVIDWIVAHRLERELKVVNALSEHIELTAAQLVPYVYDDVDANRYRWAERSLLAHLIKLEGDGRAVVSGGQWRPA
jgi:glyoxylase-like metal-dependent hydrolase (beta-lactamase superfamily II)